MKFICSIFFFLIMIAFVTAQTLDNPGTPEERAEKMTARMQQELSLTEAQLPDIQVLNLKYAKIMQAEVIDPDLNVWTMYSRGNKINKRKEEELKPLLTDVQWKKYEQMRAAVTSKIWKKIF